MEIPLYILGLVRRFGPLHGYQIKKLVNEELADFTRIKLPTIYYHLQRMEAEGLLNAGNEKDSSRPERRVYAMTAKGEEAFEADLAGLLRMEYGPSFASDALFYFADSTDDGDIAAALEAHARGMEASLAALDAHEAVAAEHLPPESRRMASIIFDHHRRHYAAETEWARGAMSVIQGRTPPDEGPAEAAAKGEN